MKLGVIADIHGNEVALRAVLGDAARYHVDRWWVLGDLVLFGPLPAEVLALLCDLPGVRMLRGNTDRYVLTAEHHSVPFDVGAVVRDLHRRRHPNAAFVEAVLTGQREQLRAPSPAAR
jgi:predicted phosphodiesterase